MDTKMLACVCPGQRVSTQHHIREIKGLLEEGKSLGLAFLWIWVCGQLAYLIKAFLKLTLVSLS
jgi:hypothetical protein